MRTAIAALFIRLVRIDKTEFIYVDIFCIKREASNLRSKKYCALVAVS